MTVTATKTDHIKANNRDQVESVPETTMC